MLMSRARLTAFWLLLLPMALVVVPRQALHHCVVEAQADANGPAPAQGHHHGDDGGTTDGTQVQAACAICQLHVIPAVAPTPSMPGQVEGLACPLPVLDIAHPLTTPRHLLANRGPPARA